MKKLMYLSLILVLILITGCSKKSDAETSKGDGYMVVDMKTGQKMIEESTDYVILDVRRPDEYSEGHIKGAINIPNENIADKEISELPDKDKKIFIYCRSGNRSKQAAKKMVGLGYTNLIEIGGITDWEGEIVKE